MTLAQLLATLWAFKQPTLNYCTPCAGHYPPSHFPCP